MAAAGGLTLCPTLSAMTNYACESYEDDVLCNERKRTIACKIKEWVNDNCLK